MGREEGVFLVQVSAQALVQPILWIVLSVKHNPGRSVQLTQLQVMVEGSRNQSPGEVI